ncbi:MAG: response regulator [Bacteroidetes bacterium]|nr:MAG: response regulator [Bacteroidota bacterium]
MGNKKILIVDDDIDIINVLKAVLENDDYVVVTAYSKKEGLEKLKTEKPDLAILDVIMETNQAGFELAREIKQQAGFEKLPLLMLTSIGDVTGVNFKAAMSDPEWLPADSYIEKPIDPDELLEEIKALFENVE